PRLGLRAHLPLSRRGTIEAVATGCRLAGVESGGARLQHGAGAGAASRSRSVVRTRSSGGRLFRERHRAERSAASAAAAVAAGDHDRERDPAAPILVRVVSSAAGAGALPVVRVGERARAGGGERRTAARSSARGGEPARASL